MPLAVALTALLAACSPEKNPEVEALQSLSFEQRQVLAGWLITQKAYRPAINKDCSCNEDIDELRSKGVWGKPIPNFQPYLRTDDFNHDGQSDLAILLVDRTDQGNRLVAIFNGPFSKGRERPALKFEAGQADVLAYGPPPENQLIVGPLFSEGCTLEPKGGTYTLDCDSGG